MSNLADYPSRKIKHQFLEDSKCIPEVEAESAFKESFEYVESHLSMGGGRGNEAILIPPFVLGKKDAL